MVWVYERANGSLPVAMLMHASYAACTFIFDPGAMSGTSLLASDIASATVVWVVVGAVTLAQGGNLSRRPPLRGRLA